MKWKERVKSKELISLEIDAVTSTISSESKEQFLKCIKNEIRETQHRLCAQNISRSKVRFTSQLDSHKSVTTLR